VELCLEELLLLPEGFSLGRISLALLGELGMHCRVLAFPVGLSGARLVALGARCALFGLKRRPFFVQSSLFCCEGFFFGRELPAAAFDLVMALAERLLGTFEQCLTLADFGRVLLLSPPQDDEAAFSLLQPAHFAFDVNCGSVARRILRCGPLAPPLRGSCG